jgi:2-oxoglutarate dehydrogenase complex dehydrogenase (E1) component-like enzyme
MSLLISFVTGIFSPFPSDIRKQGHNETDQPSFTQPRMYEVIKNKEPALEIYIKQLLDEGTLTKEDVEEHKKWYSNFNLHLISGFGDN